MNTQNRFEELLVNMQEAKEDDLKPNIDAEDFNMEDYSEDDLEKLKRSKTEDIADEVKDKDVKDDVLKGSGDNNGSVKVTLKMPESKSLRLCNDCCKTFHSVDEKCSLCGSDKTELVTKVNEDTNNRGKFALQLRSKKRRFLAPGKNYAFTSDINQAELFDDEHEAYELARKYKSIKFGYSFTVVPVNKELDDINLANDVQKDIEGETIPAIESKVNNEEYTGEENEDYKDEGNVIPQLIEKLEGMGFNYEGKRRDVDQGFNFTTYEFRRSALTNIDDDMRIEIRVGNPIHIGH